LCDRIYIMDHGKVIASGRKDELKGILSAEDTIFMQLEEPCPPLAAELRAMEEIRQAVETEQGLKLIVPKQSKVLNQLFQAAEKHHASIVSLHVQKPTLEDVFLHLTGRKLRD